MLLCMNSARPAEGTYDAIRACAEAILSDRVLQARGVSAGRGSVIDWRDVRNGETLQDGCDAFDTAQLFVSLVGSEAAFLALLEDPAPVAPVAAPAPHITAWMQGPNGGRRRGFTIGEFSVTIEPHEDDERQAAFVARLAAMATDAVIS